MNFGDMQNFVLARLRQRGVTFGSNPINAATDLDPPYEVALAINTAYNEFLRATLDFRIATLDVDFVTTANTNNYSINPCPNGANLGIFGTYGRPALMQAYEFRYVYGNAGSTQNPLTQERYIPSLSTIQFRQFTGAYTQRYGAYAAFPRRVCQQYGRRQIDCFPGTATAGDTIKLFGCPDPLATQAALSGAIPASAGGILVNTTDQPLFAPEFHLALVYLATAILCEQADKMTGATLNRSLYQAKIEEAQEFGAITMEGETEQRVADPYVTAFDLDAAIL